MHQVSSFYARWYLLIQANRSSFVNVHGTPLYSMYTTVTLSSNHKAITIPQSIVTRQDILMTDLRYRDTNNEDTVEN